MASGQLAGWGKSSQWRFWKRATTDMLCIVGGAYGLAPEILEQADLVWSLSELTFPHQLVRLIILEQLYRALSIIHHEPYHK
ncbi:MAG: 23S rRNA (pseudouridine(1915)-N(3))-methyltransferase RlmH [Vampirovibrionales bacterium]